MLTKEHIVERSEGQGETVVLQTSGVKKQSKCYLVLKRIFDIVASGLGLILLSPVFLVIVIAIRMDSKGPAIFKHYRVGKNGKPLGLYKFRSMYENAEDMINDFTPEQKEEWEANFKLTVDPRITKVGNFLRKSSLDELPQLLNILKGELSVVGPRPVTQVEVEKYGEFQEEFLSVNPGITGYWQAYARSDVDYETRMEMELYYVEHANVWWDIKIMFATVGAVLRGRGAR